MRATVRMNAQGRIVIPAEMRRALGFEPGEELVLYEADGGLRVDTPAGVVRRVRDAFARVPAERDLVKELLERRRREQAESDERLQAPPKKPTRRSA